MESSAATAGYPCRASRLLSFGGRRQFGRPAGPVAFQQAGQAVVVPSAEPAVDGGVANGKKDRQLTQALAPVVAQHGLGAPTLAGVAGIVAARIEDRDFASSQGKGNAHGSKIRSLNLCDYLCFTT